MNNWYEQKLEITFIVTNYYKKTKREFNKKIKVYDEKRIDKPRFLDEFNNIINLDSNQITSMIK